MKGRARALYAVCCIMYCCVYVPTMCTCVVFRVRILWLTVSVCVVAVDGGGGGHPLPPSTFLCRGPTLLQKNSRVGLLGSTLVMAA